MPQEQQVRAALDELLDWPPIARSPQLAKFLSYIVTSTIEGQDAQIKAYSIAVDVFGRPASFDPQTDPIVRVQARRLRSLLDQYYDEGNGSHGVRIRLPVGRYVPDGEAARAARRTRPKWFVQAVLAGALTLAIGLGVLFSLQRGSVEAPLAPQPPGEPVVWVGQFDNLTGMPDLDGFGPQLASAVREALGRFEDLRVATGEPGQTASQPPPGAYLLSGVVHPIQAGIEVSATLRDGKTVLWDGAYTQTAPLDRQGEAATAIARGMARELGPFRGPVHAKARMWLDAQQRPLPAVNTYICLVTYHIARESGASGQIADALACMDRLRREQPDNPLALAATAWLQMRAVVARGPPTPSLATELAPPLALAERAVELAPNSSIAYEHLGAVNNWLDRFEESEQAFVRSLALNPLNTDARAGYGITLGRDLQWELGSEQAALAVADAPYAPAWYYYPLALNDFREGRYAAALEAARRAMRFAGGEAGIILSVASARALGSQDVIDELLPRLLSMESLRRRGIMPYLESQVSDVGLRDTVARELQRAGVPEAALTGPF